MVIELSLELRLVRECKKRGMLCIKLSGEKGIPDRMVMSSGGGLAFLELKKPRGGGCVSPMQKWWGTRLNELGFQCGVYDSWLKIESLLNTLEKRALK